LREIVLEHAPNLVVGVIDGTLALNRAYEMALERNRDAGIRDRSSPKSDGTGKR
jgi:hypothetical protein